MTNTELVFLSRFEPGEGVCVGADAYETRVIPVARALTEDFARPPEFLCLNPLLIEKDMGGKSLVGRRADCNVTTFRNILIESDVLTLDEQRALIKESEIPLTSVVYSGASSYHIVISLIDPPTTKVDYLGLVDSVYRSVNHFASRPVVDKKCRNPSRFTRFPGAVRRSSNLEQEVVQVGARIDRAELEAWVAQIGAPSPALIEPGGTTASSTYGRIHPFTEYFFLYGAQPGSWNESLFKAACDCRRCGWSLEQVFERLSRLVRPDSSDLSTIKSAYSYQDLKSSFSK